VQKSVAPDGFTLLELLVVIAIIAIIASIAVPGLLRARGAANEASAIGSIRAITSSQTTYAATCGGGGYAASLAVLALAPPLGVPFIEPSIWPGVKSGYTLAAAPEAGSNVVALAAATCNTFADSVDGYVTTAVPVTVGSSGQRSFASDQRGTIYQDSTGVVIANPIPAGTTALQ